LLTNAGTFKPNELEEFQVFLAPNQNLKNKKGMINVQSSYAGSFSMPTKIWDAGTSVGELALHKQTAQL
jgi:hypothetical protein